VATGRCRSWPRWRLCTAFLLCVPAGVRNHFAFDVGVDRHDLIGALDAFTGGVEREIDMAEVSGQHVCQRRLGGEPRWCG
jgi:diacylglycerol kinase family enzyme